MFQTHQTNGATTEKKNQKVLLANFLKPTVTLCTTQQTTKAAHIK
jgi:hypothetical protein